VSGGISEKSVTDVKEDKDRDRTKSIIDLTLRVIFFALNVIYIYQLSPAFLRPFGLIKGKLFYDGSKGLLD
jgi:hypothetical protein